MKRLRVLAWGILGITVVLNLILTIGLAQLMLGSASVELVKEGRFFKYGLVHRAAILSSESSSLQDDIESLQADVESVSADLDSVADDGMGEIQTAFEGIQSKLDDLDWRVEEAESQIDWMQY